MNKWKALLFIVIAFAAMAFHLRVEANPAPTMGKNLVQLANSCFEDVVLGMGYFDSENCTRARMAYVKFLEMKTEDIAKLTPSQLGSLWVFKALMWEARGRDLGARSLMH